MSNELRNFLALSYDELEQLNLKAKEQRKNRVAAHKVQEDRVKYLSDEKRIKAVTVLFSDLEGRLHMLDYDKKFLLKSWDNLTFDGSSIRGFTAQRESDLRLGIDWGSFYWAPADFNGSGMHTNVSISENGKNLFWDPKGEEKLSKTGWSFIDRILTHGNDICLLLNASVNAYRRLDPHFEAPNQIKASPVDRGSMIRIPIGNEKSMRVEVRSVAPDANPYLVMLSIFKTG